jgi:hypothetical protein
VQGAGRVKGQGPNVPPPPPPSSLSRTSPLSLAEFPSSLSDRSLTLSLSLSVSLPLSVALSQNAISFSRTSLACSLRPFLPYLSLSLSLRRPPLSLTDLPLLLAQTFLFSLSLRLTHSIFLSKTWRSVESLMASAPCLRVEG